MAPVSEPLRTAPVPRQRRGGEPPARRGARLPASVWLAALGFVAFELAVSARYGFHRDELYFIVAGRHPAAGYVDQPPLAPLLTRLATALFGTSPSAIRVFPALAGGAVVLCSAVSARLLGGGSRAQLLAATAMGCAPVTLAAGHLANTTIYDLLAWSAATACALTAVLHRRSRAWLGAGVAVGLGLQNKDLLLLLVAALAVGLLATGRHRVLRDRWLWAGAAVAGLLWAPNLVWQATHGWPERAMAQALHAEHTAGGDYATVLPAQLIYLGVAAVPLALAGVRALLMQRRLTFLAVALSLVALFVVVYIPGRPYYTDGLLPVVFAAGAVVVERRAAKFRRALLAPVLGLLVTVVLILPVLPESALGAMPWLHKLNYDLGETVGWPQLTRAVVGVYHRLPPAERAQASVFTANYGEASALVLYGRDRLPPVLSGHNTFYLWGPGAAPDGAVIAVGSVGQLRPHFEHCTLASTFRSPQGVNNDENGTQLWVCRQPAGPWRSFWSHLRHYD